MQKKRVPASPDSVSFQQLWEALGSKLMAAARSEMSSKQLPAEYLQIAEEF